jgi:predicted nucleic acid-binding protein
VADAFFDTTFFIDVHNGTYPRADALWLDLLSGRITGAYSPITAYELWASPQMTRDEEVFYELAFETLESGPLSDEAGRQAGLWLRSLPRISANRRVNDSLIAATAALRNEPVYTASVRHFRQFDIPMRSYR